MGGRGGGGSDQEVQLQLQGMVGASGLWLCVWGLGVHGIQTETQHKAEHIQLAATESYKLPICL